MTKATQSIMAGDARAKELIDLGSGLFSKRDPLMGMWQEVAENFYVERADFYAPLVLSRDFAAHLMDSFPVILRRELGNSLSAMLRPNDRAWFKTTTEDDDLDSDPDVARFLDDHTKTIRSAIYDPRTKFVGATKSADHDFVTFGQGVLSVEEAPSREHLFFRNHHLRDCVWLENEIGEIDHLHRKDAMNARSMRRKFGEKALAREVKQALEKEPGKEFPLQVCVMPAEEYDYIDKSKGKKNRKHPFVVIYIDKDNAKILKEGNLPDFPYVVPRWHRVSGTQYAFSPCTVIALPDARMAQAMARILLESGEKAVDPPMVAVEQAVRDVNLQPGAITWADLAFDGKLKEAVYPIEINADMRTGLTMRQDLREMLTKAFFIDKLTLPPPEGRDMTAYEVARREEEHVRNLLPLFEPMQVEYNERILDKSHSVLMNMNAFDFSNMPDALRGRDVTWAFESPIQTQRSRILVSQYQEVLQLLTEGMQAGVKQSPVNLDIALKDAIKGTQSPATWRKTDEEMQAEAQAQAQKAKAEALMQEAAAGGQVAHAVGVGAQALQGAGMLPTPEPGGQGGQPKQQLQLPAPQPEQMQEAA